MAYESKYTGSQVDEAVGKALAGAIAPHIGENGNWFVGSVDTGTPATGPKGDSGFVPPYAASLEDCIDTSKMYLLPDGYLYAYVQSTQLVEKTKTFENTTDAGVSDNPYLPGRLGSDGAYTAYNNCLTTPWIDVTPYTGTIQLKLGGLPWIPEAAPGTYNQVVFYDTDKNIITTSTSYAALTASVWGNVTWAEDGTATVTWDLPRTVKTTTGVGKQLGFVRVSVRDTVNSTTNVENSDISITYTQEEAGYHWVSTGIQYAPTLTEAEKAEIAQMAAALLDQQLLTIIGEGTV